MERKLSLQTLLFAAIAVFFVASAVKPSDKASMKMILDLLRIPQTPERFKTENEIDFQGHGLQVLKFSWSNCGKADDPVRFKNVSLTPDPVKIPGDVTTGFVAEFFTTVDSPLKAELVIKKKVLFAWIEIPCIEDIGSCTYDDICAKIPLTDSCPEPLSTYNIPCHCPFKIGNYTLPPSNIKIPSLGNVPEWLTNGDYEVQATISSNNKRLACYRAALSLDT